MLFQVSIKGRIPRTLLEPPSFITGDVLAFVQLLKERSKSSPTRRNANRCGSNTQRLAGRSCQRPANRFTVFNGRCDDTADLLISSHPLRGDEIPSPGEQAHIGFLPACGGAVTPSPERRMG